jgi:hypothetical protein
MKQSLLSLILLIVACHIFSQSEIKLLDNMGNTRDFFGYSVGISGNYAIVGSPYHEGNIDSHILNNYGKIVVFKRNGDNWIEQDVEPFDYSLMTDEVLFGYSVDIDGDFAIVGAPWADEDGEKSGLAYIYHLEDGKWKCHTKLKAIDASEDDRFGISVAISGNYAIVGAFFDDVYGEKSGSAHIYEYNGTKWEQTAKLVPSDGAAGDWFGVSVSIHKDYAAVGSRYNSNEGGSKAGAVYFYTKDADGWGFKEKITATSGSSQPQFEKSALTDGYIVIGAPCSDDYATNGGKVYIAENNGGNLSLFVGQYSHEIMDNDRYGQDVALSDSLIVIGAPQHGDTGKVYLYDLQNPGPSQGFTTQRGSLDDQFGFSVDIDQNYIIVGAYADDEKAGDAGAAYIYKIAEDKSTNINYLITENTKPVRAFPNPFIENTTISYNLPESTHVKIDVYNIVGMHVSTITNSHQLAGKHTVEWNTEGKRSSNLPNGTYFCRIQSSVFNNVIKLVKH